MKKWNERTFLYINGELYRKLQTNKSDDVYMAQNCRTKRIQTFSYKVVRDTHEIAYNTKEVSTILGRSPASIRKTIKQGHVSPQKQSYNTFKGIQEVNLPDIVNGTTTNTGRCEYYFTPEEVHEIRDYYAHGMQYARSGKRAVPTKQELRSMMEHSVVLYVKAKDGSFVPTWQAIDF